MSFNLLGTRPHIACKEPYLRKRNDINRNVYYECFYFYFFMYQNAKTREYYSIKEKKKTLTKPVTKPPETCHLSVLSVLGRKR